MQERSGGIADIAQEHVPVLIIPRFWKSIQVGTVDLTHRFVVDKCPGKTACIDCLCRYQNASAPCGNDPVATSPCLDDPAIAQLDEYRPPSPTITVHVASYMPDERRPRNTMVRPNAERIENHGGVNGRTINIGSSAPAMFRPNRLSLRFLLAFSVLGSADSAAFLAATAAERP
jgi:hypothetical protein